MNHHYSKNRDRLLVQDSESKQVELLTLKRPARSFPPTQNFNYCQPRVNHTRPASSRRSLMRQPAPLLERRSALPFARRGEGALRPLARWNEGNQENCQTLLQIRVLFVENLEISNTETRPSVVQKKNSEKHAVNQPKRFLSVCKSALVVSFFAPARLPDPGQIPALIRLKNAIYYLNIVKIIIKHAELWIVCWKFIDGLLESRSRSKVN